MSAYRYLVFPKHQQPTAYDVAEFQSYASVLKNRCAIGKERQSESLVFAFDQNSFDNAMTQEKGFELLIRKWQAQGCQLVDKLKFVKDHDALRPTLLRNSHLSSPDKLVAIKKELAQEAIARSLLSVQRTLDHYSWLQRIGSAVPYALIAGGTLALIIAGFYISGRIQEGNRERRLETIERVSGDALNENLNVTESETTQEN